MDVEWRGVSVAGRAGPGRRDAALHHPAVGGRYGLAWIGAGHAAPRLGPDSQRQATVKGKRSLHCRDKI